MIADVSNLISQYGANRGYYEYEIQVKCGSYYALKPKKRQALPNNRMLPTQSSWGS